MWHRRIFKGDILGIKKKKRASLSGCPRRVLLSHQRKKLSKPFQREKCHVSKWYFISLKRVTLCDKTKERFMKPLRSHFFRFSSLGCVCVALSYFQCCETLGGKKSPTVTWTGRNSFILVCRKSTWEWSSFNESRWNMKVKMFMSKHENHHVITW